MPYKTGIRLLGIARNPANGFPARLLGEHRHETGAGAGCRRDVETTFAFRHHLNISGIGVFLGSGHAVNRDQRAWSEVFESESP